jgi:hypothetical protein
VGSLLFLPNSTQAQDLFRDIDLNTSKVIERLYYKSIDSRPSLYRAGRREMTRYEAIVLLIRMVKRVEQDNKNKEPKKKPVFSAEEIEVIDGFVRKFEKDTDEHFNVFGILSSELFTILNTTPSFPDIPANHWAYKAVHELKEAGIFVGYPTEGKNTFLYHAPKR